MDQENLFIKFLLVVILLFTIANFLVGNSFIFSVKGTLLSELSQFFGDNIGLPIEPPTIESISPNSATTDIESLTVTINGTNFNDDQPLIYLVDGDGNRYEDKATYVSLTEVSHTFSWQGVPLWSQESTVYEMGVGMLQNGKYVYSNALPFSVEATCEYCTPTESSEASEELHSNIDSFFNVAYAASRGDCANPERLSPNCTIMRGDRRLGANWLWCYYKKGSKDIRAFGYACGLKSGCEIETADVDAIAETCKEKITFNTRLTCVIDEVKKGLQETKSVCRHFARCTKLVLEKMGISQTYQAYKFIDGGHAWNTIVSGEGKYFMDSYNNILFWCPNTVL